MRRPLTLLISVVAIVGLMAGCGSSGSKAGTATTGASGPTMASGNGGATPGSTGAPTAGSPTSAAVPGKGEVSPSGDIPDTVHYNDFTPAAGGFTLKYPESFSRQQGVTTLFTDKLNSIRLETHALATAPTVASVTSVDLPKLAATTNGYRPGKTTTVTRPAGPVILSTYSATSAPDSVTGKQRPESVERYVFWKGGKEVVLTMTSPQGADNVDPWRKVTDSFGWR